MINNDLKTGLQESFMPYVDIKCSKNISDNSKENIQIAITDMLVELMGKTVPSVMISITESSTLYKGKEKLENGVYIDLKAFGESPKEVKKELAERINTLFTSEIDVNPEQLYLTFDEKTVWGANGTLKG
jgi:phenylpyruvate tautomerase PptA (4-oxalocrotonate tautomerase family)